MPKATADERLDKKICLPLDGQEVGMDEPFVSAEVGELEAPPAHPGCRCLMALEIKE